MTRLTLIFPIALILFLLSIFAFDFIPSIGAVPRLRPERAERGCFCRNDRMCAVIITIVYAVTAFVGLGDLKAPTTYCQFTERGQYALVELEEPTFIGKLMYFTSLQTGAYRLQFSEDGEEWVDQQEMNQGYNDLFKWKTATLNDVPTLTKYVRMIADGPMWLAEVALFDTDGRQLDASTFTYDPGCAMLFDEQDLVPEEVNYMNSAYFDEIYHPRTAFEHLEGMHPYEISHPPLGKLIISLGISLFGMTPFGWRCMGVTFGALMLPMMYYFAKKMFCRTSVAACVTAIFATDFMHFTQTRLATIDTYAVFFTIAMYMCMYMYLTSFRDYEADDSGKMRCADRSWMGWLSMSGIFFGLGAASKWTCIYAGAGLGVIWLIDRIARAAALTKAGKKREYAAETWRNILWCIIFFVIIPAIIYYASYYPYGKAYGLHGIGMYFDRDYFDIVLSNQKYMFSYHSGVTATHPYSSVWYQWILDIRPILYYLHSYNDATKSAFGAFVNPVLCWGGIMAMVCMVYLAIFRRDNKAIFILIGYLAQLLPWTLVTRVVFEYHYFPSTVFLLLAIGRLLEISREHSQSWKLTALSITGASIVLFTAFYPVLSGMRVSVWYTRTFLRWLPDSWPF